MAMVETVMGPVDASTLGVTLSHEHVLVSQGDDIHHYPWMFDWEKTRAIAIEELREAKAGGIDSMIDLTTPDLGRDIRFMRDVVAASSINVVAATGIWRDVPRSFWTRDLDEIADIFVREIEVGIDDSGIRAGVIKVANDMGGVTEEGERILRGAARALKRTGCPISTHQWAPEQVGARQVEIFREEGAPMDRITIGHSADTTDVAYLESLLNAGVYLSMDRYPGLPPRVGWEDRNATTKALIDRGWTEKLMMGHDYAPTAVPLAKEPPERMKPTRYLFVTTVAHAALREQGVSQETLDTMMRIVPRRFLTGEM